MRTQDLNEAADYVLGETVNNPESGCMLWPHTASEKGYGAITRSGEKWLTHRLVYEVKVGHVPAGMFVCHHCDTPRCVRPEHLFLGTHRDNMADKRRKGRCSSGEQNGNAKVTDAQVGDIRAAYRAGSTLIEIGERFGLHFSTVSDIVRGSIRKGEKRGSLIRKGESHGRAKLTDEQMDEVRSLRGSGLFQREVAEQFHISQSRVSEIWLSSLTTP